MSVKLRLEADRSSVNFLYLFNVVLKGEDRVCRLDLSLTTTYPSLHKRALIVVLNK